jgi:hypothetical protein
MGFRVTQTLDRAQKYARFLVQGRFTDFAVSLRTYVIKAGRKIGWRVMRTAYRRSNRAVPKAMQTTESIALHRSYSPKPYYKRLVIFRANDLFALTIRDRTLGWHRCAAGGVDVHFVRGDHGTMVQQPDIRDLVEKLMPYLAVRADVSNVTHQSRTEVS